MTELRKSIIEVLDGSVNFIAIFVDGSGRMSTFSWIRRRMLIVTNSLHLLFHKYYLMLWRK